MEFVVLVIFCSFAIFLQASGKLAVAELLL
nr:MAG TPA: hypothetical protein [Crassvirales sp.]